MRFSSHTCYDGHYQNPKKIAHIGQDVKKLEHLYTVGRNVKWCSHYEKQYAVLSHKVVSNSLQTHGL